MLYYRMEYVQSGRTFKTSAKTMEKLDEYIHGCLRCGNRIKGIEAVNLIDEIKKAFAESKTAKEYEKRKMEIWKESGYTMGEFFNAVDVAEKAE